ncbi:aldose 1-epimerase family protein [Ignavigranum ruoffiae]|uniref:aldose 1-epimerase family protein n=1 Tax=Ignavigranum ruoffiae TaxID=89093 RepID=UPI00235349B6|nr:aldose 1-epimerase family protein [Ignavigranum ruoffiae]
MIILENKELMVTISEMGAEIQSIIHKDSGHEFIWQADPKHWNRSSPVLFPNVGTFKDNSYTYQGMEYQLGRHGFARDLEFTVQNVLSHSASFYLKNSAETLQYYPFEFSLQISYILFYNQITVSYEVLNPSEKLDLYYSIGAHPAFNVAHRRNIRGQEEFDQVAIEIQPEGHYLRIPLNRKGLTRQRRAKYEKAGYHELKHLDFKQDAIIYQIGQQTSVTLHDPENHARVILKPHQMEWLGIWSTYPTFSPFVCLELWAGIADDEASDGNLVHKQGIRLAKPHEMMNHSYTMDFVMDEY